MPTSVRPPRRACRAGEKRQPGAKGGWGRERRGEESNLAGRMSKRARKKREVERKGKEIREEHRKKKEQRADGKTAKGKGGRSKGEKGGPKADRWEVRGERMGRGATAWPTDRTRLEAQQAATAHLSDFFSYSAFSRS